MKEMNMKQRFIEAKNYLKESYRYILFAIILFAVSGIIGFLFHEHLARTINNILKSILLETAGLSPTEMLTFILQNNTQSAFFSIFFGVLFGIIPIINAVVNGVIIGYVLAMTLQAIGSTLWWKLLPHGIFELPAIFIAIGLGIRLGFALFIRGENRLEEFGRRFYQSANAFLIIIFPLLVIAAIIEGILIFVLG